MLYRLQKKTKVLQLSLGETSQSEVIMEAVPCLTGDVQLPGKGEDWSISCESRAVG